MLMNTKNMVLTALLLAACMMLQSLKGFSVYITGSAVNTVLIIATLAVGTWSGMFIAVITPLVAALMGQTPIMQMIPLMIPVIMLGNGVLVFLVSRGRKGNLPKWLAIGAILKAGVLWILVWYAILPFFGAHVPAPVQIAVKTTFSLTQLITASIGAMVAYAIHQRIKKQYM